jgi:uncharacterized protein YbaP (TraB family)
MKFRRAWLALIAIALSTSLYAQSEAPRKTFLWEVKSASNTLYVFGGPGIGNGDLYPVSFWAEAAYSRAQVLAVEADLSDGERFQRDTASMYYAKEDSLASHISKQLYEEVADFHAIQGLPMTGSDHLKPYAVAFGLMNKEAKSAGLDPYYDAPFYFTAKAQADQKPIVEIEGVAAQLRVLDALPQPLQEELLKSAVEHSAAGNWPEQLQTEVAAWKSGDVDYYAELDSKSYQDMPHGAEIRHQLIETRHPAIAEKLASYLGSGKVYFAVLSAQHMVGPDSLIDELIKRGFKVQRL